MFKLNFTPSNILPVRYAEFMDQTLHYAGADLDLVKGGGIIDKIVMIRHHLTTQLNTITSHLVGI